VIYRRLVIEARVPDVSLLVAGVRGELERLKMRVLDIASTHDAERCELTFSVALKRSFLAPELTERLSRLGGVQSASWKQIR
jgi:hypothetical protein